MMRQLWTEKEIAKLRQLYPHCRTKDLASIFRRPMHKVYNAAV